MDNIINETNERLQSIINNLQTIGREYEEKLNRNTELIESEREKANTYKNDFAKAEAKINKMNADIVGFENDYNHLVEKFKDDELSSILIAANREISAKIDERKKKILKDQIAMNSLVQKAESVKTKLVKLYAEKKVLEYCYQQIVDAYDYYSTELGKIINYSNAHRDYLCECYEEKDDDSEATNTEVKKTVDTFDTTDIPIVSKANEPTHITIDSNYDDVLADDYSEINMDGIEDVLDNPVGLDDLETISLDETTDDEIYEEENDDNDDETATEEDVTEDIIEEPIESEDLDKSEEIEETDKTNDNEDIEFDDIEIVIDDDDEETDDTPSEETVITVETDSDDDFIYLDNLELDEDDNEGTEKVQETSYDSNEIKEVLDATAKELEEIIETDDSKDELLNYLEISDEDLEKLINQNDDLED